VTTPTAKHCCDRMRLELRKSEWADGHSWPADVLVAYLPKFDEYGIVVHDGGSSMIQIHFCPWCGTRLPPSRRDEWFDSLRAQGIDPLSDDIPPKYRDDAWYRRG